MHANEAGFEFALAELKKKWRVLQDDKSNYSVEVPEKSLKACFNKIADKNPDKAYVIHKDVIHTYAACNQKARRIANGLSSLGCVKGDRVALYLCNGINFVLATQACFKLGLIVVNANPSDLEYEVKLRLQDSGATLAFVDEASAAEVCSAVRDMTGFNYLIDCSDPMPLARDAGDCDIISFLDLLANSDDTEPDVELHPDEVQVLQYTGGTTGGSKGCCVTHRNYLYNAYGALEYYGTVVAGDEWIVSLGLPMSHAYGFTITVISSLVNGGTMVLASSMRPSVDEVLSNVEKYKATAWPVVPAILYSAISEPGLLEKYDLSSLKCVTSGAAPLPVAIIKEFESITGSRISEGYGLSETVRTLTAMPFKISRPGKVGIPFPNMELLIVDVETGCKVLPVNEPGEIIARGAQVTKGYWNKPEETKATYRGEWLYTGDIGYLDEEGILTISGRIKDLILVSGFNVYPKEIDELLSTYPDVLESATIGIADERRGEAPKSFIVKRAGSTPQESDIEAFLRSKLVGYKIPKVIQFVDAIPKTKANKVDKAQLKLM